MKKVAIILTGDPRHIEFCYPWWQGVVEHADYETIFYSTTWEPKTSIQNSQTTTVEEVKQFEKHCSPNYTDILTLKNLVHSLLNTILEDYINYTKLYNKILTQML